MIFVWKIRGTDLLSVRTITMDVRIQEMQNSQEYIDNLVCEGLYNFEPNATGAQVFRFDLIFWPGSSSVVNA